MKTMPLFLSALALGTTPLAAQSRDVPHIATRDGHHALIVDGAPFLMLGAQVNNSSNYPSALPAVWPMLEPKAEAPVALLDPALLPSVAIELRRLNTLLFCVWYWLKALLYAVLA